MGVVFTCYAAPSFASDIDTVLEDQFIKIGDGGCRTADGGKGTKTVERVDNLQECFEACLANLGGERCVAVEFFDNTCELHTEEITDVGPNKGKVCFSRVFITTTTA